MPFLVAVGHPLAGHFVVYFAIREGREAWEGGLLDN